MSPWGERPFRCRIPTPGATVQVQDTDGRSDRSGIETLDGRQPFGRRDSAAGSDSFRGARRCAETATVYVPPETAACSSAAGGVFESSLAIANFEAVPAVDGLDVEDVFRSEAENALDRCGHVFVHSVGKLNHDDGAFTRGANQTTRDGS